MPKTSDYENNRIKFRTEFIKRRLEYWAKNREEFDKLMATQKEEVRPISDLVREISKDVNKQKSKTSGKKYSEDVFHEYMEMITCFKFPEADLPSIDILEFDEDLNYSSLGFDYNQINLSPKEIKKNEDSLLINSVTEGKFIPILINLNRKKGDIIRDVKHLLNTLDRQAHVLKTRFKRPKPHWEEYDKYLKVFDLKTKEPKMPWSEIAMSVFPEEVYENIAPHRKRRKEKVPSRTAIDKVRYYHREANRIINKGGWKRI